MLKMLSTLGAGAAALAVFAPAQAATTFGSATAVSNAVAYTNYGQVNAGNGYGGDTETLSSFDTSLEASAGATADSYGKHTAVASSASALEDTNLSLTSAASGTIDLAGITSATSTGASDTGEAYSEGQAVTYNFSLDTASVFSLSYNYTESYTDPGFYNSIYLSNNTTSSLIASLSPSGSNTSGVLTYNLAAGAYTFNVYTQIADLAYASGVANFASGEHEELYKFDITSAAPEPSVWMMLTLGVGLAGLALRSRPARVGVKAV
jgi:hypothetical protein